MDPKFSELREKADRMRTELTEAEARVKPGMARPADPAGPARLVPSSSVQREVSRIRMDLLTIELQIAAAESRDA